MNTNMFLFTVFVLVTTPILTQVYVAFFKYTKDQLNTHPIRIRK